MTVSVAKSIPPRRGLFILAMVPALAALSACSDDASGQASASDVRACVEAAQQNVDAAMEPMTIADLDPFDASAAEGMSFMMVQISGKSEISTANADGFIEALDAVGATGMKYDGAGNPDTIAQGIASAIAQDVDAILTDGFDPSLVPSAIADAEEAGIPVISAGVGVDNPLLDGVVSNVSVDNVRYGQVQADYALVESDCDVNAAVFFTSAGLGTVKNADGVEEELDRLCSSCEVERVDVDPATYATTMTGQVQTTLQRSPDMNYLITTADFWTPYLIEGSDAVDRDVPIIGGAQGDQLPAAIEGNGVVAELLWPPAKVMGWYEADAVLRAVLAEPTNQELPIRLVDESNWGSDPSEAAQFPELVGFEDVFKQVWGVG